MLGQFLHLSFCFMLTAYPASPNCRTIGEFFEDVIVTAHRGTSGVVSIEVGTGEVFITRRTDNVCYSRPTTHVIPTLFPSLTPNGRRVKNRDSNLDGVETLSDSVDPFIGANRRHP